FWNSGSVSKSQAMASSAVVVPQLGAARLTHHRSATDAVQPGIDARRAGVIAAGMEIFSDGDALAAAAADALAGALTRPGRRSLVVTGGTSPGAVYDRLARLDLDWPNLAVALTDERCVDAASPPIND